MRIGFEFCLVMAFSAAMVAGASAAPKVPISKGSAGTAIQVNPGGVAVGGATPLTESECEGLGGSVVPDAGICSSGAYCMTEDQAGNRRRVCLSVFVP